MKVQSAQGIITPSAIARRAHRFPYRGKRSSISNSALGRKMTREYSYVTLHPWFSRGNTFPPPGFRCKPRFFRHRSGCRRRTNRPVCPPAKTFLGRGKSRRKNPFQGIPGDGSKTLLRGGKWNPNRTKPRKGFSRNNDKDSRTAVLEKVKKTHSNAAGF